MSIKNGDLTTTGVIIEMNKTVIRVKLTEVANQPEIYATICGKMRQRHIKLIVGDRVKIIIPQASPNLGIIKYREQIKTRQDHSIPTPASS